MKKLISFLIITSTLFSIEQVVEKRPVPTNKSTSVIIPCHVNHFQHLPELLIHFKNQSKSPNEIVISVSEVDEHAKSLAQVLLDQSWPFLLKFIVTENKKSAGENRNIAAKHATGDILICQDADDLPHPQRVEIIKYMFDTYQIDHLVHAYISYYRTFTPYKIDKVRIIKFSTYDEMIENCTKRKYHLTNGNVSYTKEVAKNVLFTSHHVWEDILFNRKVFASYNSATIFAKLLQYRRNLSVINPGASWDEDIDF